MSHRNGTRSAELRLAPIALAAMLALSGLPAWAQPPATQLPVVRAGSTPVNAVVGPVTGTASRPVLGVTQTPSASNRGVVEWSGFSIGSQATVNIVQPNAQSVLINRVTSDGPRSASEIYGSLNANGRVFLVNPAGVVFGPGAQVNVGSLVATSLDLADGSSANGYKSFLDGRPVELLSTGSGSVQVLDGAVIKAQPGGSVVLVGSQGVAQHGAIEAAQGRVNLSVAARAEVLPLGTSGYVELVVAPTAPAVTGASIDVSGSVNAGSATGNGGSVRIDAGPQGSVTLAPGARISVASTAADGRGGDIAVQGRRIDLQATAPARTLDADGTRGGGTINVGDDHTRDLRIAQGATLSADATGAGDGGEINARANYRGNTGAGAVARQDYGVAEVYGSLLARGGLLGGNGGRVDTSGTALNTSLYLPASGGTLRANVDARARSATGQGGTWTLDPFNVTISDTASTAVAGTFTPTAAGANVRAADISAALNAGTNVEVNTGTAATGTEAGTITVVSGTTISRTAGTSTATLTLRAHENVIIENGSTISAGPSTPLNINLYSDLDGNGSGGVQVNSSSLSTGGGNLTVSGGSNPTTGFATADAQFGAGASLSGTIDTRGNAGAGNVTVRGAGNAATNSNGVAYNSDTTANNITILGKSTNGTGTVASGTLTTDTGTVDIRGLSLRTSANGNQARGLDISGRVNLGSGSLLLTGRGDDNHITPTSSNSEAVGLVFGTFEVRTGGNGSFQAAVPNGGGRIVIAGEAANSSGYGVSQYSGEGVTPVSILGSGVSTAITSLASVEIGAISATGLALHLIPDFVHVQTSAGINFRPLGVDATTGAVVERPAVPISVGSNAETPTGFVVEPGLLSTNNGSNNMSTSQGFVIGSSQQTGAITVADNALTNHGGVSINLQNQGANSGGIVLGSGNSVGNLGLFTSGNVSQTGGLTVQGSLAIQGGSSSDVNLSHATNQIGRVAFDSPNTLNVVTQGDLTIGTPNGTTPLGFNSATGTFTPVNIGNSTGGTTAVLRSTNGQAFVEHSITMGAGAGEAVTHLDIASPSQVTLSSEVSLNATRANVWAPTITGLAADRNLYGCVYGDGETCSVSGITVPSTGRQGLYPTRPSVTVTANAAAVPVGAPLPTFTYTSSGLVNGDTAAGAFSGTLTSTATTNSPAGVYAITQGSLTSPTGYLINYTAANLSVGGVAGPVTPVGSVRSINAEAMQSSFLAQFRSDVYGRNLSLPYICTAASVIRESLARETRADPLASEWGKVRSQPQLSGCLEVNDGGQCAAF